MKEVKCLYCGSKKPLAQTCPKCGKDAEIILQVDAGDEQNWKSLSEHRDYDEAYKTACELFDGGMEEDFYIKIADTNDPEWPGRTLRYYELAKENCPVCGAETRVIDTMRTRDCRGILFRRVCMKCYERIMETKGYDGEEYDERDENLDIDY